jgi:hypothetical protein
LKGLAMKDVFIFYGHLIYFMVLWYISPILADCAQKNLANPVDDDF